MSAIRPDNPVGAMLCALARLQILHLSGSVCQVYIETFLVEMKVDREMAGGKVQQQLVQVTARDRMNRFVIVAIGLKDRIPLYVVDKSAIDGDSEFAHR